MLLFSHRELFLPAIVQVKVDYFINVFVDIDDVINTEKFHSQSVSKYEALSFPLTWKIFMNLKNKM